MAEENGYVIRNRLDRVERRNDWLMDEWRPIVDADRVRFAEQIGNLMGDLSELTSAVNGLRKTILAFALSIAASAVIFALTTLAATGRL